MKLKKRNILILTMVAVMMLCTTSMAAYKYVEFSVNGGTGTGTLAATTSSATAKTTITNQSASVKLVVFIEDDSTGSISQVGPLYATGTGTATKKYTVDSIHSIYRANGAYGATASYVATLDVYP